jgi:hypothetical protein
MIWFLKGLTFALILCGAFFSTSQRVNAQVLVVANYPALPVVSYVPRRAGLFGLRTVYRPVVSYAVPRPVATYYAPSVAVPTTTYFAPAPVRTYYAPAPTVIAPPVTTYYAPAFP